MGWQLKVIKLIFMEDSMDIFDKCFQWQRGKEAIDQGFYPYFIPLTENEGTEVEFHGHRRVGGVRDVLGDDTLAMELNKANSPADAGRIAAQRIVWLQKRVK